MGNIKIEPPGISPPFETKWNIVGSSLLMPINSFWGTFCIHGMELPQSPDLCPYAKHQEQRKPEPLCQWSL